MPCHGLGAAKNERGFRAQHAAVDPDRAFTLTESRTTPGGVIIQVYRPAGRPEYA